MHFVRDASGLPPWQFVADACPHRNPDRIATFRLRLWLGPGLRMAVVAALLRLASGTAKGLNQVGRVRRTQTRNLKS